MGTIRKTRIVLPTDMTVTTPAPVAGGAGWVTKTHFDPTRALPLSVTDPNGRTTYIAYDALGRTSAVWRPGRPYSPGSTSNPPPNSKFSYTVNGYAAGITTTTALATVAPSMVETDVLREVGTYAVSTALLDSMGRTRQTQNTPPSDDNGRVITDTSYDSAGRVEAVSGPYYDPTSSPSGSFWVPTSQSAIPSQNQTQYDGLGRTINTITVASGAELWRTHTDYPGVDRTDVTPPSGGARTSTITDSRGQATALYTYHAGVAFGTVDAADADALTYFHDRLGDLAEVDQRADTAGHVNKWTFGYNMLGQKTTAGDPDAGNSSYAYDLDGNLQTTTAAIGSPVQKSLFYTYDLQNRRTAEYAGTSTAGTEQASWSYDSVPALTAAQSQANPGSDTLGNLGRAAGSIRYSASGQRYSESVIGYDANGNALSSSVSIPNADGNGALAGTYTTTNHYTALGQLTSTDLPVGGDLQPDTVGNGYDVNGLLIGTTDSYADLLTDSSYSPFGESERRVLGDYPNYIVQDTIYDQPTRRVTNSTVSQLAWNAPIDTTAYTYDPSGHITAAVDNQGKATAFNSTTQIASANVSTDAQCYHYDYAGRLDAAWSDTGAVNTMTTQLVNGQPQTTTAALNSTNFGTVTYPNGATGGSGQDNIATAATTGGLGSCANIAPTPGVTTPTWTIGGPQPYAQVFGYDDYTGDRKTETDYATTGAVSNTSTYNYNAPGASQPHLLTSVNHTTGATTDQYQYDAGGNTTVRTIAGQPTQNLTWDAENRMSGDTDGSGAAAAYLYDADGNQLIRRDATTTTLYLGATELHLDLAHNTVTGDRYFSYPGAPTIVESGGATPHLSYEAGNLQGTASTTIDASPTTADQAITARRAYTPFNTPRGTNQNSIYGNFLDDHTFLGKTTDTSTGLVDMGARKYDPTTGRFVSIDPLFQATNPQAIGGYVYADDNPVDGADPTGLGNEFQHYGPSGDDAGTDASTSTQKGSQTAPHAGQPSTKKFVDYLRNETDYHGSDDFTWDDVYNFAGQNESDWNYVCLMVLGGNPKSCSYDPFTGDDIGDPSAGQMMLAWGLVIAAPVAVGACVTGGCEAAAVAAAGCADAVQICAAGISEAAAAVADGFLAGGGMAASGVIGGGAVMAGIAAEASDSAAGDASLGEKMVAELEAGARCHSFSSQTKVLMADGATESIADIKVGDEIENAQPGGREEKHRVDQVHVTHTDKDFTDLTIATPTGPHTVTGTQNHPYWDVTDGKFIDASQLRPGDRLQTTGASVATVLSVRNYTSAMVTYDLTIDGLHTYYVLAGDTPVLVHNASCGPVALGTGNDLAEMAAEYRMKNGISASQNIAVFEYETGAGPGYITAPNIPNVEHSESVINSYLQKAGIDPQSVTRIYSERMPCAGCRVGIGTNFPQATISYSLTGTADENYVDLLSFMNAQRGG